MIPPPPSKSRCTQSSAEPPPFHPSERLAKDVKRLSELFAQAPGCMIMFVGPDHVIQMANPAYRTFTGLLEDIIGQPAHVALSRGYSRGFGRLLDHVYSTGEPRIQKNAKLLVNRFPGGPDEEAYGDFVLQPLRDSDGVICGVFCQGHEVTVEKLAADELRAGREQLRAALSSAQAIFDNSHDVICETDDRGVFQQVNQHAERIWGYRPDELIGRCYADFLHPDDVAMTREVALQVHAGQTTKPFINRYLHKDGTEVPVMWSTVRSEASRGLISIGRDMREHMAAEEKLRQAQKLEAIGRLTGGIAHDFNNLLTVVIGSTEALTEALSAAPELASIARLALDAAERGAELVSRLLAFARSQPLAPQAVDCKKFLEALLPILQRTLRNNIEVTVEASDGDLFCLADLTQLTSAVLNLCINARDAMPAGGTLTLCVSRDAQAQSEEPSFVVFSVEDSGEGMSPQTRARALDPFFTTKPEGQGSGLGLSMVHGFVGQSGGRLEIESETDCGTCVRIFLPETAQPQPSAPIALIKAEPIGPRHILLVEDDELLRGQVERQLTSLGCRVTAERNGHDALSRLGVDDDVDLLMTDIVMPGGMNGRELADQARRRKPELRILFTSGHTDESTIRALRMDSRAAFIAKPYRRAELTRKLTEVFSDQAATSARPSAPLDPTEAIIAANNSSTLIGFETTAFTPASR